MLVKNYQNYHPNIIKTKENHKYTLKCQYLCSPLCDCFSLDSPHVRIPRERKTNRAIYPNKFPFQFYAIWSTLKT